MSKAPNIRWAQIADGPRLVPLLRALYAHDMPDTPAPKDDVVNAHIGQLLDPDTPHRLAIAWDEEGTAIALAAAAVFTSVSDPRPKFWKQMELKELFVLPDHRSGGVGVALLNWVEARARKHNVCRMDWHVKADNDRGIAFYERWGGEILTHRKNMRKGF